MKERSEKRWVVVEKHIVGECFRDIKITHFVKFYVLLVVFIEVMLLKW